MSDKNDIQEAEIIETSVTPADSTLDASATINSLITRIDQTRADAGKFKDLLDSIFANDPTCQTHEVAVKEAQKIRNLTKKQIMKLPQALDLSNKIADKKAILKELQSDLSSYLQDYSKQTGFTTFESASGDLLEIVIDYRVRKISK